MLMTAAMTHSPVAHEHVAVRINTENVVKVKFVVNLVDLE